MLEGQNLNKIIKLASIFFFKFVVVSFAYGCDCNFIDNDSKSRLINYEESNLIFVGILVDNKTIVVSEFLKSSTKIRKQYKVVEIDNCSLVPEKGEVWLVYSTIQETGAISINQCSRSRSFSNPNRYMGEIPPPLMKYGKPISKNELKNQEELFRLQANVDLLEEIEWLRAIKSNNEFESGDIKNQYGQYKTISYVAIVISILSLMVTLLITLASRECAN